MLRGSSLGFRARSGGGPLTPHSMWARTLCRLPAPASCSVLYTRSCHEAVPTTCPGPPVSPGPRVPTANATRGPAVSLCCLPGLPSAPGTLTCFCPHPQHFPTPPSCSISGSGRALSLRVRGEVPTHWERGLLHSHPWSFTGLGLRPGYSLGQLRAPVTGPAPRGFFCP